MTYMPSYLLLVIIGSGEVMLAYFTLITAVHGIFQQANLQLRLGLLNRIFSMAELHRWHHSRTVFEANHNYGQTISIWDWVFGTRYLPVDRTPPEDIGIANLAAFPMSWWAQELSPFRWGHITIRPWSALPRPRTSRADNPAHSGGVTAAAAISAGSCKHRTAYSGRSERYCPSAMPAARHC